MAEKYDILLDESGDVKSADGDLVIGEVTEQNQRLLLSTSKGEWKQNPRCGVGTIHFIESSNSDALAREIRTQFIADGMKVSAVKINIPNINVEAAYED